MISAINTPEHFKMLPKLDFAGSEGCCCGWPVKDVSVGELEVSATGS